MDIATDIFHAVIMAGLPLMALSFAVIWWALSRGRLQGTSVGELQKSIEVLGQQRKGKKDKKGKKGGTDQQSSELAGDGLDLALDAGLDLDAPGEKKEKLDPVLDKWFSFGGGFYGIVALYTWILAEWNEVWNFMSALPGIVLSFNVGALISLVINLFIESLMNFITAISWPVYWLQEAGNPWIWIGVAYGGYWLGIKAARHVASRTGQADGAGLPGVITRADEDDA